MTKKVNATEKENEVAVYLFHQGTNFRAYEYMGCHPLGKDRTVFRTWAPRADAIDLVSDFTGWENGIPFELKLEVPNDVTAAAIVEGRKMMDDPNAPRYTSIEALKEALGI